MIQSEGEGVQIEGESAGDLGIQDDAKAME